MRPLHPSAVPASMIDKATQRRLAGDWQGACSAAGVTIHIDVRAIGRQFGAETAEEVEEDLRHLVPDLLRWYLPRDRSGFPRAHVWYPLALLPDDHAVMVHAHARRHIELHLGRVVEQPGRRDDTFLLLRDRWDSRRTADILDRCGLGTGEGLVEKLIRLDDSGRHAAAWAVAGYELKVLLFDRRFGRERIDPAAFAIDPGERNHARGEVVRRSLSWLRPIHTTLAVAARRTLEYVAELRDTEPWPNRHVVTPSPRVDVDDRLGLTRIDVKGRSIVLDGNRARLVGRAPYGRADDERREAETAEFGTTLDRIPRIPDVLVHRPEELDALLGGPTELHPLVRRTLFPAEPATRLPEPTRLRTTLRVHCDHATHEVVMRDGGTVIPHTPAEIDREMALAALGGRVQGCFAAREGWRDPQVRPPRRVVRLQFELQQVIRHGDTGAVLDALDRGLDPHVRFHPSGETLLHVLPLLPGGERLLRRLLTAGLDPNARDRRDRTPLHAAVANGSPELVRALLKAGANPKTRSARGGYVDMAGYTNRRDLAFLNPLTR